MAYLVKTYTFGWTKDKVQTFIPNLTYKIQYIPIGI